MNILAIVGGSLCGGALLLTAFVAWALARVGDIRTPSVFDKQRERGAA